MHVCVCVRVSCVLCGTEVVNDAASGGVFACKRQHISLWVYSVDGCVQLVGMSMVLPIGDAPVSHTHVYNVYGVR